LDIWICELVKILAATWSFSIVCWISESWLGDWTWHRKHFVLLGSATLALVAVWHLCFEFIICSVLFNWTVHGWPWIDWLNTSICLDPIVIIWILLTFCLSIFHGSILMLKFKRYELYMAPLPVRVMLMLFMVPFQSHLLMLWTLKSWIVFLVVLVGHLNHYSGICAWLRNQVCTLGLCESSLCSGLAFMLWLYICSDYFNWIEP